MKKYLFALYALTTATVCFFLMYVRNADYMIETASLTPYYSNTAFFCDGMQRPGGLLIWIGSFLTSCFYHPLLGTFVMILLLIALAAFIKGAFSISFSSDAICFIPSLLLILNYTQLGYMIYVIKVPATGIVAVLGLMSSVLLFWAFKSIKKEIVRRIFPIAIIIFTYPLFGFYALFSILLILIYDVKGITKTFRNRPYAQVGYDALYIIIALITPYIYYLYLYSRMHYADIYSSSLPDIHPTGSEHVLRYPLFAAGAFIALITAFNHLHVKPYLSLSTSLLLMVAAVITNFRYTYVDENFNTILKMERAVDDGNWQEVIDVARTTASEPTRLQVMFTRLALWETGEAGNHLFNYQDGDVPYQVPRKHQYMRLIGARSLYYYFGKVNYSYRWCMEDMVEYGKRPAYLKYMAKCAIINGEDRLAKKYLNLLLDNPFTAEWAQHYMPYTSNSELIRNDKEMMAIKDLMNYDNLLDGDSGLIEVYLLNSFALMEGGTRQMVELSLLCNLIMKDTKGFWPRFLALLPTFKDKIPIHYQEAALLFSNLEHQYDVSQLPIDKNVRQRFQALVQASSQNGNNGDDYNATVLKPEYGDTYWYYYFFVKGMKTN